MWSAIGSWLLGVILSKTTGELIQKAFDRLTLSADGAARLEEIRAGVDVALSREGTKQLEIASAARNERQATKMNQPVFWILIIIMVLPAAWHLWAVGLYNLFWHANGIWPQPWNIAAYPPSVAPWVEKSIDWLYDPLGVPAAIGSALAASWLTGRR